MQIYAPGAHLHTHRLPLGSPSLFPNAETTLWQSILLGLKEKKTPVIFVSLKFACRLIR